MFTAGTAEKFRLDQDMFLYIPHFKNEKETESSWLSQRLLGSLTRSLCESKLGPGSFSHRFWSLVFRLRAFSLVSPCQRNVALSKKNKNKITSGSKRLCFVTGHAWFTRVRQWNAGEAWCWRMPTLVFYWTNKSLGSPIHFKRKVNSAGRDKKWLFTHIFG